MSRPRRLNVAKIRQASTAEALSREIRTCLTARADGEVSNQWSSLKTSVYGAAEKILGYTQRRRSDWVSGRTLQVSAQTARARSRNDDYFRQLRKMTAKSAKDDQEQYWAEIATSMEQASNVNDTRKLYRLVRQVSGRPSTLTDSVRDVNRGFIADNSAKVERWREHFERHLNFDTQPTSPLFSSSAEFLPSPTYAVPCDPSTPRKKSPMPYESCTTIRHPERTVYPLKSLRLVSTLWCPVSMRSDIHAEAHSRISPYLQQPTAVCFVDSAATFDSVHRESLWRIMAIDAIQAKIIAMKKAYYSSTTARVLVRNNFSQPFGIRSDVRQGCILSPILFNYSIDWILGRALRDSDGVEFVPGHRLTDLDYADDIALLASSFADLQSMVSRVNEVAKSVVKEKVTTSKIPDHSSEREWPNTVQRRGEKTSALKLRLILRDPVTFQLDEAEILANGDNRVRRKLLESWHTGRQSINKCNELPLPYSVLRLRLGGVISHEESAHVSNFSSASDGGSVGRAIITQTSNARDEIAAINDANVAHHATCNVP
nr:unnamed protein product [Spirometra erinaceieuropaei]